MIEIKLKDQVVKMREPKVSDLVMLDKVDGEMAKMVALTVNLCQLTEDEVLAMSSKEFKPFREKINSFL